MCPHSWSEMMQDSIESRPAGRALSWDRKVLGCPWLTFIKICIDIARIMASSWIRPLVVTAIVLGQCGWRVMCSSAASMACKAVCKGGVVTR